MKHPIRAALLSLLPCLVAQQTTPGGAIHGTLTDTAGIPLACHVIANSPALAKTADSNNSGQYTIPGLVPGAYTVTITCGVRPTKTQSVKVTEGEDVTADARLPVSTLISGRVLDPDGKPAQQFQVLVDRAVYDHGRQRLLHGMAKTNEKSEYWFTPTPDYPHYITAVPVWPNRVDPISKLPADVEQRKPFLAPTFYGNTAQFDSAVTITVRPGEQREQADIRMVKSPSYCVDGTLRTPDGVSVTGLQIHNQAVTGLIGATPQNSYRICDLAAGQYFVTSFGTGKSPLPYGMREFVVDKTDAHHVDVVLTHGVSPRVEVTWDAAPPDADALKATFSIMFLSIKEGGEMITSPATPFPYEGPLPGRTVQPLEMLAVTNLLPASLYVKKLTYDGVDVLNQYFQLAPAGGTLRMIVGDDGASLTSRVVDSDDQPVAAATVVVLPDFADTVPKVSQWMRSLPTNQRGTSDFSALAPGKYRVLTFTRKLLQTEEDCAKLLRARGRAEIVEVGPRASAQLTLHTISID